MGFGALFYPWGLILQALAIIHFIRRRPEPFWLWIILFGGGLGALIYIVARSRARRDAAADRRCRASHAAAASGSSKASSSSTRPRQSRGARRPLSGGRQVRAGAGAVRQGHLAAHRFESIRSIGAALRDRAEGVPPPPPPISSASWRPSRNTTFIAAMGLLAHAYATNRPPAPPMRCSGRRRDSRRCRRPPTTTAVPARPGPHGEAHE